MDIWTIVIGIGVIVSIVAGAVQVLDYFQKRREIAGNPNKKPKNVSVQIKSNESNISKPFSLPYSKQNTLSQILKLVSKAEQLAKQSLHRFESNYVYPEDCDLEYADMQSMWDEYLLCAFEMLDGVQKSSEKVHKLKTESRLLADSLYSEIRLVMQEVQEFRRICLENNLTTTSARIKIRDRVSELHTRIKNMLEQLS